MRQATMAAAAAAERPRVVRFDELPLDVTFRFVGQVTHYYKFTDTCFCAARSPQRIYYCGAGESVVEVNTLEPIEV